MNFFWYLFLLSLVAMSGCQSAHKASPAILGTRIAHEGLRFKTGTNTTHSLAELSANKKGTVFIFWQQSCPCVKRYQGRINALFERFGDRLAFFHVSSNLQESNAEVLAAYERRHIPVPLIFDEDAQLKKALDIRGTPSAALVNAAGELLFVGWIDNERNVHERGRHAYLENAISQMLKDELIATPSSPMFGCAIR